MKVNYGSSSYVDQKHEPMRNSTDCELSSPTATWEEKKRTPAELHHLQKGGSCSHVGEHKHMQSHKSLGTVESHIHVGGQHKSLFRSRSIGSGSHAKGKLGHLLSSICCALSGPAAGGSKTQTFAELHCLPIFVPCGHVAGTHDQCRATKDCRLCGSAAMQDESAKTC